MTTFDIEEKPAVWFEMEGGGRIQLRTLTSIDMKEIRKKTTKRKVDYKRIEGKAERFDVEEVDKDLENELFWDRVIVAWENLFDSKERPIECTRENKVLLMSRSMKFVQFITESMDQIAKDETAKEEDAEKNSLTPPVGS